MQRYYTSPFYHEQYTHPEVQNLRYRWRSDISPNGFYLDPGIDQPPLESRPKWRFFEPGGVRRWDDKARAFPHMQDMIRTTDDHGFFPITQAGNSGTDNRGYVAIQESEETFRLIEPNYLLNSFFSNGLITHPESVIGETRAMYQRLVQQPFTKAISIERNPFDSQFSIWMLTQDFTQLPKLIASGFKLLASLRKLRYRSNVVFGLPFREWMDGHLAIQFGLLPTLQDLKEFISIVKRWGQLLENAGTTTAFYTYRVPKRIIEEGKTYDVSYNTAIGSCNANLRMRYTVGRTVLCQCTKYYFVCPELHGLMSYVKKAVDRLGLLDPAAAWDRVPFSFVLDWFVDVGGWLHKNLKPKWYPVDIIVTDWAETLIRDTSYVGDLSYSGPKLQDLYSEDKWYRYGEQQFVQGVIHQYARKRQFPAPLTVDRGSIEANMRKTWLRANRVIIGACLVGQKSRVQYRHYIAGRYIKRARIN
jgi:hypothetical protein